VQPLEDLEDPLPVLRRDADAVVAHREDPLLTGALGRDVDARRAVAELQRVADQTSRIVLFVLVVIPVVEGLLSVVDALSLYDLPGAGFSCINLPRPEVFPAKCCALVS
jgi:hypothetical protein